MAFGLYDQSLIKHRKTSRAAAKLRVDRHKIIGHLVELWAWALDNVGEDGALGDLSDIEIADAAGWPPKDARRFVTALVEACFVDDGPNGRAIHDWPEYGGRLQARRAKERDRLREKRADERTLVAQQSSNGRAVVAGRAEKSRVDRSIDPPAPSEPPPARKAGSANGQVHPTPKPDRSAAVIRAIRACGIEPNPTDHDHAAIKKSTASPDLIAEVFAAVHRGEYGDDFMQRRLSVREAIGWIDGYLSWKARGRSPVSVRANGHVPVGAPGRPSPFSDLEGEYDSE